MSEARTESPKPPQEEENNVQATKTPMKNTPSKRKSNIEKARAESEELIKAMGGSVEGGRRTRSSARGTTAVKTPTPPPAKKPRVSTPSRRGRPKRDDLVEEKNETDSHESPVENTEKSEEKCEENDVDDEKMDTDENDATKQNNTEEDSPLPVPVEKKDFVKDEENKNNVDAGAEVSSAKDNCIDSEKNDVESDKKSEKVTSTTSTTTTVTNNEKKDDSSVTSTTKVTTPTLTTSTEKLDEKIAEKIINMCQDTNKESNNKGISNKITTTSTSSSSVHESQHVNRPNEEAAVPDEKESLPVTHENSITKPVTEKVPSISSSSVDDANKPISKTDNQTSEEQPTVLSTDATPTAVEAL